MPQFRRSSHAEGVFSNLLFSSSSPNLLSISRFSFRRRVGKAFAFNQPSTGTQTAAEPQA
ncbi:hypothetical protein MA16_Dca020178 [Dendrobium catenatum]|uniref:Uncharacterized protein n=1 Tax=Dendrobium catenatum TaxID=906689 RepID=A0A2I0VUB1_9ASPA|nr:hypothetical protein MA16_Dca020178 [Dendrobium catenatum]